MCLTEDAWRERVADAGKNSPLQGLADDAIDLIYAEQPLHRGEPEADPLVIVNKLDNTDKHRMLHPAFIYPAVERGLDLIEIQQPDRVKHARNAWTAGQPLEDGTQLATFFLRGGPQGVIASRQEGATLGYATGIVGAPRIKYADMVDRVRQIAEKATDLMDRKPQNRQRRGSR